MLSALGISIGIAAIVGVLGISQSSKTGLLNELGQLGNLISVQAQNPGLGQPAELPVTAEGMVSRVGPVLSVTEIGEIANVYVYRTPLVPASDTSGISLTATDAALPATLGATVAHGTFLNAATARYPAVVLGAETASLLGINDLAHPIQLWIGGHWFTVVGILNPVRLISQMDSMAFIGFPVAEQYFGFDGHPTGLYLRSAPGQVTAVAGVLPATADPANPSIVAVSEAVACAPAVKLTLSSPRSSDQSPARSSEAPNEISGVTLASAEPWQVTDVSAAWARARLARCITAAVEAMASLNDADGTACNNVAGWVVTVVCCPLTTTPVTRPRKPSGVATPCPMATICPTWRVLPPE